MTKLLLLDSMKQNIQQEVGLSPDQISEKSPEEVDQFIAHKVGKETLEIAPPRTLAGRGSVLLSRLIYTKNIDRRLARIR